MGGAVNANNVRVEVFYPCISLSVRYSRHEKIWKYKINTNEKHILNSRTYDAMENVTDIHNVNLLMNLQTLNEMKKLENDWNGNGGIAFSSELIAIFTDIIRALEKQPQMAPTGRGSLQIQYELPDRSYLGFEIFKDKVVMLEVPERDYSRAKTYTESKKTIDFINKNVRRFYEEERN